MSARTACSEVTEHIALGHCVHLVIRLTGSWEQDRDKMVSELERRTESVEKYAQSAAFRKQFGNRVPVLRVQAEGPAPSIVEFLLAEQGIEVEDTTCVTQDGPTCVDCQRDKLPEKKAAMSARGWVCPSCDRARRQRFSRRNARVSSSILAIPAPLLWPVLAMLTIGFFVGVGIELTNLGQISQSLRTR